MILGFTLLIVTAIGTLGVLSYYLFGETLRRISLENTSQVVGQLNRVIDNYISYMDDISRVVIYNNEVQGYLEDVAKGTFREPSQSAKDRKGELKRRVGSLLGSIAAVRKDIDSIVLVLDDNTIVTDKPGDRINPHAQRPEPPRQSTAGGVLGASLSSSQIQNVIAGRYPWVITLSREVRDVRTSGHRGTLLVNLNYAVIEDLCSEIQLGKSGYVFIVNRAGDVVYHPRQELLYSGLKKEPIDLVERSPNSHFTTRVNGREVFYTTNTSTYTGWTVVGVSFLNEMFYSRSELTYYFALIAIFSFFISVIISSFISEKISRPIEVLRHSMQAVEGGNFDISVSVNSTDEVNGLARDFDIAIKKIKELITQNALANEEKRKHELKALQAQINPHFLYNTLDSIIWMIECGESEDAITMTSTLAKFFRLGISRGGDITTVDSEIDHLGCYLTIQKMRYKDKLDFAIEIDPQIRSYWTLKLLIQPLVENAIYHGLKSQDRIGMIRVTGDRIGDSLVFRIIDNGVGMTKRELSDLYRSKSPTMSHGGVGVTNVRERIQLYFGRAYGISFESKKGVGTTATIRLPTLTEGRL